MIFVSFPTLQPGDSSTQEPSDMGCVQSAPRRSPRRELLSPPLALLQRPGGTALPAFAAQWVPGTWCGVAWCSSQQRPGPPPTPSPSPCPPAFLPEQRGALLNLDALKIAAPGLSSEKPEPVRGQLRPPLCPASAGLSQHGVQGSGPACWPVVRAWSRHRRTIAAGEQASHQALPQGFRGLHSDL